VTEQRSKLFKFTTVALKIFWRALYPVNILLELALLLQLGAGYMLYTQSTFDVPDFVKAHILKYAAEEGFEIADCDIRFCFDASVEISNASIRLAGTPDAFFKAEKLRVSISKPLLFIGQIRLNGLRIEEGALSPTFEDVNESPLITGIFAHLDLSEDVWKLRFAEFYMGHFYASLRGEYNENFPLRRFFFGLESSMGVSQSAKKTSAPLPKRIDEICAQISNAKNYLAKFEEPCFSARFRVSEDRVELFRASFAAEAFDGEFKGGKAYAKNLRTDFWTMGSQNSLGDVGVRVRAENLKIEAEGESAKLLGLDVFCQTDAANILEKREPVLQNADIFIPFANAKNIALSDILVKKRRLSQTDFINGLEVFARYGNGSAQLKITGSLQNVAADFEALADLNKILSYPFASDIKELEGTKLTTPMLLRGHIEIAQPLSKTPQIKLAAKAEAANLSVIKIPLESLSADIAYDSAQNFVDISNVNVISKEGWRVRGGYAQNLLTNEYHILLDGAIEPMRIACIMEPWWTNVFSRLKFTGVFPKADAYITGIWGAPDYIWSFVDIHALDVEMRGCTFKTVDAKVYVSPTLIALFDANAKNGDGFGTMMLGWEYAPEDLSHYSRSFLYGKMKFSQREFIALAGQEAEYIFDTVGFVGMPEVEINAELYNSHFEKRPEDLFNLKIRSNGQMQVDTISVSDANFFAISRGNVLKIEDIDAKLCGGTASGAVYFENLSDKKNAFISLDLNCKDMRAEDFLNTIANLGGYEEKEKTANAQSRPAAGANKPAPKENPMGDIADARLNGQAAIAGKLGDVNALTGYGNASMSGKTLGKIHLLGIISRALGALGTNMGTFDINNIESPLEIKDGFLSFGKVSMGGPNMKILGSAKYRFDSQDVYAKLLVSPFGSMKTPVISRIFSLIDPLISVFEVTVNGKLENPKVGIALRPLNFFNSEAHLLEVFGRDVESAAIKGVQAAAAAATPSKTEPAKGK